jgi:pyruvate ferredoxin oxidoreductase gamma subunit
MEREMTDAKNLIEIRWHGRGGQGAVTSAELIAQAAISEGKFAQAFPSFGPERRGAPVQAFNRIDRKEPVRIRADINEPDVVVVLDPSLLSIVNVTSGLKEGGLVIINTKKTAKQVRADFGIKYRLATVNATKIAREQLGVPIVNTTMLGAIIKATGAVTKDSIRAPLEKRFGRLGERNIKAMETAFAEVSSTAPGPGVPSGRPTTSRSASSAASASSTARRAASSRTRTGISRPTSSTARGTASAPANARPG